MAKIGKRAGSIKYQVKQIIEAHNAIGESKREYRQNPNTSSVSLENGHRVSNYIHSIRSRDDTEKLLKNLGEYAKEKYSIRNMSKIDKDVVKSWLENKDITSRTASDYTSILNKVSEHFSFTREDLKNIKTELKEEGKLRQNIQEHRAYEKLDQVNMPGKSQIAFELQRDYGLRMSEATHIKIDKQLNGNTLKYQQKGGRWSEREISKELADKIREQAKDGTYHVSISTYAHQLKREIEKTGQVYNGTHGIRHTFAQNEIESGKSKEEVSHEMGHVRTYITNTYLR